MATAIRPNRDHFHLQLNLLGDDGPFTVDCRGTEIPENQRSSGEITELRPFVQLESERRFCITHIEREIDSRPSSLLETPSTCIGCNGWSPWYVPTNEPFKIRGEALSRAAEWNQEEIDEYGADSEKCFVVVELGQPLDRQEFDFTICENGVGKLTLSTLYPVRVVEPTEAEKAQYPVAWPTAVAVEGGAA